MEELNFDSSNVSRLDNSFLDNSSDLTLDIQPKSRKKRKKKEKTEKNIVPNAQRAWQVGYNAAQSNLPEYRNPFMEESSEHEAWLEGWWAGFYDEPLQQMSLA